MADTYNHTLRQIALPGGTTSTWLGTGDNGDSLSPVQFDEPSGLSVAGNFLFVADTNNHRIVRVDLESKAAIEFVVDGLEPIAMPE